jgi:hypothetical protein
MNQPKFKFGDKVFSKEMLPFTVFTIMKDSSCDYVYYSEDRSLLGYMEYDLELFKEPEKKKLYAFINSQKEIGFKARKSWKEFEVDLYWVRAPEYDIEYPEAKL